MFAPGADAWRRRRRRRSKLEYPRRRQRSEEPSDHVPDAVPCDVPWNCRVKFHAKSDAAGRASRASTKGPSTTPAAARHRTKRSQHKVKKTNSALVERSSPHRAADPLDHLLMQHHVKLQPRWTEILRPVVTPARNQAVRTATFEEWIVVPPFSPTSAHSFVRQDRYDRDRPRRLPRRHRVGLQIDAERRAAASLAGPPRRRRKARRSDAV